MCLAIPSKIVDAEEVGGFRVGNVQFGGIARKVYLDFVPEAVPGDYVIVHVGFAISRVDAEEAGRTYALLEEMGALAEEGIGTATGQPLRHAPKHSVISDCG
jgi:hydrogenase expression/formation protein HypC